MLQLSSGSEKLGKYPRYFVPDLSPMDRVPLQRLRPQWVFIAESPHVSEVSPEEKEERRPLCGAAGKKWWALLGELLGEGGDEDVSLSRMLNLCKTHRIAVINVVQYPLDEGVKKKVPQADPLKNLGFCKNPGSHSYKKLKQSYSVQNAIEALRIRLMSPVLSGAYFYCLGNDAEWFVKQALTQEEFEKRVKGKLPHPSAWWRRGGHFGRLARKQLSDIIKE